MEAIVVGLVFAALMPVLLHAAGKERRRRYAVMVEVASRRGGRTDPGSWVNDPWVEIERPGIRIRAQMWSTKNASMTVWKATLDPPGTAAFRVSPHGFLAALGQAFGAQDVVVGTLRAFDDAFVVKAVDPDLVARVLRADVARRMVDEFPAGEIESADTSLELHVPRLSTADTIVTGIELILAIAAADAFGLEPLRALPRARLQSGRQFPHAVIDGPGDITIGPELQDELVVTRARGRAATRGEAGAVEALHRERASALGTRRIAWSAHDVTITWPRVEVDPAHLEAAIELLQELARPPAMGVFR